MMKVHTILIAMIILVCPLLTAALYFYSQHSAPVISGFQRVFISAFPKLSTSIDLGFNSYYLAGFDSVKLYYGNVRAPQHVVVLDVDLGDTAVYTIIIPSEYANTRKSLIVFDHRFLLADGVTPFILTGNVGNWEIDSVNTSPSYFSTYTPIGAGSSVLRIVDPRSMEYVLRKESISPAQNISATQLLQKQVDGIFCKDGMLHYDISFANVVYVYYYRNEVVVADTSLNLIRRFRTIDPVDSAKFTVDHIYADSSITTSSPTLVVNKISCVFDDKLYIASGIRATNEAPGADRFGTIVDIYQISTGSYIGSFYLPHFKELKANEFQVIAGKIIARYARYIVDYDFKFVTVRFQ